ncbi:MAG: MarR family transcriptional regulator [Pseudomonadota bacterium]
MSDLNPEASVGFLIHDVSRNMRAWFDARAQALGLTRAQWRVLIHLTVREGANQTELAEILEIDTVSLGRHIDRLQRDNWLERRPDPTDRRAWRIYLSETRRPVLTKMKDLAAEIEEAALAGLSEQERAVLIAALTRIKQNVTDLQADADPATAPEIARAG